MPVGGSALVVTGSSSLGFGVMSLQVSACLPSRSLSSWRGEGTGCLQAISCTGVQLLSASTNLPFWLGENNLCSVQSTSVLGLHSEEVA